MGKRPKEEEIGKPGQTTAIIGKVGVAGAAVAGAIAPGQTTAIIGKAGAAIGAYAATWIPTGAKLAMDLAIERAGGAMETISITVAEWTSTGFKFVPWDEVLETIKAAYATVVDTAGSIAPSGSARLLSLDTQYTHGIRQLYDYMLSLAGKTPEYVIDSLCSLPDWLLQNLPNRLHAPLIVVGGAAGAAGIIYLGSSVYKWIRDQKTKLLGTSVMDFGYVLSRDLHHDDKEATPNAITKWQIHEAIMQGLLKAPKMKKGMYKPQNDNAHTLQFLTPARIEGRAARTDFALHF